MSYMQSQSQGFAKMNVSLQTMNSEIQSLKTQETGGETKPAPVGLHRCRKGSAAPGLNDLTCDHFYTTDLTELGGKVEKEGYVYEGLVGHVFPSPVQGTVPLFRFFNSQRKDHHYTTNLMEPGLETLFDPNGYYYSCEGICCYIFPKPVEGTRPLFRYYNERKKDHFFTIKWRELGSDEDGYVFEGVAGYLYN